MSCSHPQSRYRVVLALLVIILASAELAAAQSPCSPVRSNGGCTVTIDREIPSSPQTIRLDDAAAITLIVTKRPLETVSIDATFTDVAGPDALAQIAGAFLPTLKDFIISAVPRVTTSSKAFSTYNVADFSVSDPVQELLRRLRWIQAQQERALTALAAAKSTTDSAGSTLRVFVNTRADAWSEATLLSERIRVAPILNDAAKAPLPVGVIGALDEALKRAREAYAALALRNPAPTDDELKPVAEAINGVAANQTELNSGLASLQTAATALAQAGQLVAKIDVSTALRFSRKYDGPRRPRTLAAKISVQDQLSKTTTSLATVNATWGTTPWELSAGPLFSWMTVTTFQNAPKFVDGQPVLAADGKVNTFITKSTSRPTVVPFVLGHYRVFEASPGSQRIAGLISGGVGVNPHSKSVDFAYGVSGAYRLLVVSYLGHRGRELELINGLQPDDSLGSSPPALATDRFWRTRHSLAITVRVPF